MAEQRLAALQDLLSSAGPPEGPLSERDVKVLMRWSPVLAKKGWTTETALRMSTEDDLLALFISPEAARRIKIAFPGYEVRTATATSESDDIPSAYVPDTPAEQQPTSLTPPPVPTAHTNPSDSEKSLVRKLKRVRFRDPPADPAC